MITIRYQNPLFTSCDFQSIKNFKLGTILNQFLNDVTSQDGFELSKKTVNKNKRC